MTPDQIKARCEEFGETWAFTSETLADLESLYREAMAAGLEMAAEHIEKFADAKTLPARTTLFESFCLQEGQVLRTRASKLKESPCEPSSS